jgi:hypothetical protein
MMPPGAAEMIREGLEWSTPATLAPEIQAAYPNVTAQQVHAAWTEMSEILWQRDKMQLPSAELLLKEFGDDVDIFDLPKGDGVEQLCWGMRKIADRLRLKIVEIGIDATCEFPHLDTSDRS